MLIEAAAPLMKSGSMTLEIVGDGPQMPELRELVQKLGVAEQVTLTGWVDHRRVRESLARSDLFAFPSIREFGGAVVLEAMAAGVVPVVVDYGGPGELVTPNTGFLIPLGLRQEIIANLRRVLAEVSENPARIAEKSPAAIHRAREQFTWQNKAQQVMEIYQWVLGNAPGKPVFPMPLPDAPVVSGP
jgi:glycosyltransferase involved in cell wall biosynthesis